MTDHRARGRARRLVAVFVALFTVPVAFLVVALAATAEIQSPVTAAPVGAAQQALSEPCDPTMTECPDPPTEPTDTTPTDEPTSEPTSVPTTAPPTTEPASGGGGGGSGGGGGGSGGGSGGGGSVPRAPVVPQATTTASPVLAVATLAATQVPVQPTDGLTPPGEVAAPASARMPSGVMLGSTAGILVAFAVSVAFLVRERRAYVREREEDELEHWRSYR